LHAPKTEADAPGMSDAGLNGRGHAPHASTLDAVAARSAPGEPGAQPPGGRLPPLDRVRRRARWMREAPFGPLESVAASLELTG
jgi:hypothetical protein